MNKTSIEWVEQTWNPLRGCSRVSEGCRHCYAERIAARFSGRGTVQDAPFFNVSDGYRWNGRVELIRQKLYEPLRRRKPTRIFACSMSDLFHPAVPESWIVEILAVVAATPQHQYYVLTKRPARMRAFFAAVDAAAEGCQWPLPNVAVGVSVETQRTADERIPQLAQCPAAMRFLSCEPLLGPINLGLLGTCPKDWNCGYCSLRDRIHWVIVGGESGRCARPTHPDWVRSIRDQCADAGVLYCFKQWGEWLPAGQIGTDGDTPTAANTGAEWGVLTADGAYFRHTTRWMSGTGSYADDGEVYVYRVGRRNAGRMLDGREHNSILEIREKL